MKEIELTHGYVTQVDAADYERLMQHKWWAIIRKRHVYAGANIDGKQVLMHRLLMDFPAGVVDHKDGDGLNNTRSNLRACSPRENLLNSRSYRGTSQFKGVSWVTSHGKWGARIQSHGRLYFLGLFASEKAAAIAYNRAARRLFGEFARLNEV